MSHPPLGARTCVTHSIRIGVVFWRRWPDARLRNVQKRLGNHYIRILRNLGRAVLYRHQGDRCSNGLPRAQELFPIRVCLKQNGESSRENRRRIRAIGLW